MTELPAIDQPEAWGRRLSADEREEIAVWFVEADDGRYPFSDIQHVLRTAEAAIHALAQNEDLSDATVNWYKHVQGLLVDLRTTVFLRRELPPIRGAAEIEKDAPYEWAGEDGCPFWLKSHVARVEEWKARTAS
jgi:hypothetical protein